MIGNSRFRQRVSVAAVALLGTGAVAAPSVVSAAGRVALVVGNSNYTAIGALPNPGNDAADVSAALGRLGFEVTPVLDADRVDMNEALRTFTRESVGADVALVFYAGHGLEMDGVNYLVPVDARLERDTDVRFEAVELDDVLAATAGAALRVVILDACRNNPLARSMQRTSTTRNVSRGSFGELDENLLGDETLVAYAAAAGTTAADGTGRNSPYTTAFLEYLEQPLEIGILFREVRARVLAATGGEQRPHEYASLLEEHYLRGASGQPGSVTVADVASADVRGQQETVFWQSISASTNPADYRAYLQQFPDGVFARLARNRMTELGGTASASTTVSRPRPMPAPTSDPDLVPTPEPNPESLSPVAHPHPRAPGVEFRDCPTCPEMVVVPQGMTGFGAVLSFALGKYEVTRKEYASFVAATGHAGSGCSTYVWKRRRFGRDRWEFDRQPRASWRSPGFDQGDEHPVVCISAEDALAYVRWLSQETGAEYRLPSFLEWMHAAVATGLGWRPENHCAHANYADRTARLTIASRQYGGRFSECTDGFLWTAPVGSFTSNAFGLYDMLGNASEWAHCRASACSEPQMRGGSWVSSADDRVRTFTTPEPRARFSSYGFRVARTLDYLD